MKVLVKLTRIQVIKIFLLSIIVVCLSSGCSSEVNFGGTTGGTGEIGCPPSKFSVTDEKELAGNDEKKFNADMAKLDADLKELGRKSESSSLDCTL